MSALQEDVAFNNIIDFMMMQQYEHREELKKNGTNLRKVEAKQKQRCNEIPLKREKLKAEKEVKKKHAKAQREQMV